MSLINCWQRYLTNFIWADKKHYVNLKTLHHDTKFGGIAFPNLYKYYQACHISLIITVLQSGSLPIQVTLFEESTFPFDFNSTQRTLKVTQNTYLLAALVQWDKIKQKSLPPLSRFFSFL